MQHNSFGSQLPLLQWYFCGRKLHCSCSRYYLRHETWSVVRCLIPRLRQPPTMIFLTGAHSRSLVQMKLSHLNIKMAFIPWNWTAVCSLYIICVKCSDTITVSNAKDWLLVSLEHNATFLFRSCYKFICSHFFDLVEDKTFVADISEDSDTLWQAIVRSAAQNSNVATASATD
jgi:hypothetical protein